MKIGIVCYPTFGGSGVVATELGLEMAALGHQVHFISYSQPVRLDLSLPNVFYHEVVVLDYPLFDYSPYELILTSKLVSVVREQKLDILHVHYAIPHASAAYMARKILEAEGVKLPIVCTLHGTDITLLGRDASFEPVITFAINESDAVTAVSDSLKADTYAHFDIKRHVEVIPNFINLDRYKSLVRYANRAQYAPEGMPLIIHVSNFRKVKRVQDVVKVFRGIRSQMPAKLLLVGDGPERYNIEQMCRQSGCCEDINFLGKSNQVEEILANADLFILPSETESFGLAALEAMAAGVPVISSNSGGLPEVNVHGFSGFLSAVGDTDDMITNALVILKNEESLKQFSEQAKIQAKKFGLEEIIPQYEALYQSLL
jgi:N-acetyl-alpha-D-glucosaminyl L-malate synthase BshA